MKTLKLVVLLTCCMIWDFSMADASKFAYVDVSRVDRAIFNSDAAKKARSNFKEKLRKKEDEIVMMRKEIQQMKIDFKKRASLMQSEAKKQLEKAIRDKELEYQLLVEAAQTTMKQENSRWNKKITTALKEVIVLIGRENHYTAIFGTGQTLFVTPDIDITQQVIQRLNTRTKEWF